MYFTINKDSIIFYKPLENCYICLTEECETHTMKHTQCVLDFFGWAIHIIMLFKALSTVYWTIIFIANYMIIIIKIYLCLLLQKAQDKNKVIISIFLTVHCVASWRWCICTSRYRIWKTSIQQGFFFHSFICFCYIFTLPLNVSTVLIRKVMLYYFDIHVHIHPMFTFWTF